MRFPPTLSLEAKSWQRGHSPLTSHTVDGSWGAVKENVEARGSGQDLLLGWGGALTKAKAVGLGRENMDSLWTC